MAKTLIDLDHAGQGNVAPGLPFWPRQRRTATGPRIRRCGAGGRVQHRARAGRGSLPPVDVGVLGMFDIQTELHLRRIGQKPRSRNTGRRRVRALLILANLSGLAVLAAALG